MCYPFGHSNLFRDGHVTQARSVSVHPRHFVATTRKRPSLSARLTKLAGSKPGVLVLETSLTKRENEVNMDREPRNGDRKIPAGAM